uniref:TVP38/TMEM64 family membrane protein n=1 Tax=candidate division WOR-3 bacterium TaxID=2052148 RepID=A0A7C4XLH5_UNCW3
MTAAKKIIGIIGLTLFIFFIVFISIIFIRRFGGVIESPIEIRKAIEVYGIKSYLVFFLLYIFQIFFAPVPGQVLNIASGILFGPARGFLVSFCGVLVGGFLAMAITRYLGKKILYYFLEEKGIGFEKEITKRGLPLIIFLAIFPNPIGDGIYYLAGLTRISLKLLIGIIGICRIPGILVYVIAGDKILTAGIKGWIVGAGGFLLAILFYLAFRKKIEKVFERIIDKSFSQSAKSQSSYSSSR